MVELDGFKTRVNGYAQPLEEVRESLDLENKEQRVESWKEKWRLPDSGTMQNVPENDEGIKRLKE